MAFFDFLKGKNTEEAPAISFPAALGAPVGGTFVPMNQIPDEVFSTGVLGACCGVEPEEGRVYAPVAGKISQLADTLHAVGIEAGGMELLIHVGVDTVEMKGDGFASAVKLGQTVREGDLLLTMDMRKIYDAGHPSTVILAVTNSEEFGAVEEVSAGVVQRGDSVLLVRR